MQVPRYFLDRCSWPIVSITCRSRRGIPENRQLGMKEQHIGRFSRSYWDILVQEITKGFGVVMSSGITLLYFGY